MSRRTSTSRSGAWATHCTKKWNLPIQCNRCHHANLYHTKRTKPLKKTNRYGMGATRASSPKKNKKKK
jgi:hypothetical protein